MRRARIVMSFVVLFVFSRFVLLYSVFGREYGMDMLYSVFGREYGMDKNLAWRYNSHARAERAA